MGFLDFVPESAHQVASLMGTVVSGRRVAAHERLPSHTYSWLNAAAGEMFWVKYHFKTDQGTSSRTQESGDGGQ